METNKQPLHPAPLRVEWDSSNRKEVEERKKIYQQARKENRKITTLDGESVTCFKPGLEGLLIHSPELKDSQFRMIVLDETGDRRFMWDSMDPHEVLEAAQIFEKYIKKGWIAYAVDKKGNKGQRIYKFNARHEEVFFDEEGLNIKLKNFVKKFKEIKMLPKTRPG